MKLTSTHIAFALVWALAVLMGLLAGGLFSSALVYEHLGYALVGSVFALVSGMSCSMALEIAVPER